MKPSSIFLKTHKKKGTENNNVNNNKYKAPINRSPLTPAQIIRQIGTRVNSKTIRNQSNLNKIKLTKINNIITMLITEL